MVTVFVPSTGFLISTLSYVLNVNRMSSFRPLYGVPNFYCLFSLYNMKEDDSFRPLYGVPNFYPDDYCWTDEMFEFSSPLRGS